MGQLKRLINITGRRFDRLLVLSRAPNNGNRARFNCLCDCGKELVVYARNLHSGNTKSCGCRRRDSTREYHINRTKNLEGMKFGRVTVLKKSGHDSGNHITWECECDCGTIFVTRGESLRNGVTTSCGCYKREMSAEAWKKHGMSRTPEYHRMMDRKREEGKKSIDSVWTLSMEIELKKMFPVCVICGKNHDLCVDHVLPLINGNGLRPGNATILCRNHNSSKKERPLNSLPKSWKSKILESAKAFEDRWNMFYNTAYGL